MRTRLPILVALLIAGVFMNTLTVYAVEFGGLGGHPTQRENTDQHSNEWFMYTLQPGQSQDDTLEVINNTDQPVTAKLYPADSAMSSDGTFAVEQEVESRDLVGSWIHLSQTEVAIPPTSSVVVPFTIIVPADAEVSAGQYTGGILIEDAAQKVSDVGGIALTTRTGVRVYVTIPGHITHGLHIEQFSLAPLLDDHAIVDSTIAIHNDGNVAQDATIVTEVDMTEQWQRYLTSLKLPTHTEAHVQILPGQTLVRHQTITRPWFGTMSVQAYVLYHGNDGDTTITTAPATLVSLPPWYVLAILTVYGFFWIVLGFRWYHKKLHGHSTHSR